MVRFYTSLDLYSLQLASQPRLVSQDCLLYGPISCLYPARQEEIMHEHEREVEGRDFLFLLQQLGRIDHLYQSTLV